MIARDCDGAAIEVGDTVYVAKPTLCCNDSSEIGEIFVVTAAKDEDWKCDLCGASGSGLDITADGLVWHSPERCKKIPPLSVLEHMEDERDITTTA